MQKAFLKLWNNRMKYRDSLKSEKNVSTNKTRETIASFFTSSVHPSRFTLLNCRRRPKKIYPAPKGTGVKKIQTIPEEEECYSDHLCEVRGSECEKILIERKIIELANEIAKRSISDLRMRGWRNELNLEGRSVGIIREENFAHQLWKRPTKRILEIFEDLLALTKQNKGEIQSKEKALVRIKDWNNNESKTYN